MGSNVRFLLIVIVIGIFMSVQLAYNRRLKELVLMHNEVIMQHHDRISNLECSRNSQKQITKAIMERIDGHTGKISPGG